MQADRRTTHVTLLHKACIYFCTFLQYEIRCVHVGDPMLWYFVDKRVRSTHRSSFIYFLRRSYLHFFFFAKNIFSFRSQNTFKTSMKSTQRCMCTNSTLCVLYKPFLYGQRNLLLMKIYTALFQETMTSQKPLASIFKKPLFTQFHSCGFLIS